jgi:capsular polysaccharide export protein
MFHYVDRPTRVQAPYILLLQGPVGPFFRDLQAELTAQGLRTKRITFNAGDDLFSTSHITETFTGSLDDWAQWLSKEIRHNSPDFIVIFGARRPVHYVARQVATAYGVRVICLEEGYLRSGYVTCEIGGNNDSSPLCQWAPSQYCENDQATPTPTSYAYLKMCFWAAIYYLRRDFQATEQQKALFHRKREGVLRLAVTWVGHALVRGVVRQTGAHLLRRLRKKLRKRFVLVVLQVPSDSQLLFAARGWSNEKLIQETLFAFHNTQTSEALVFKLHPLDRQAQQTKRFIQRKARDLGMMDRVHVLRSGAISDVTAHATGMIVINSTSAFSALHHNIPVLVLGDAIYRHGSVVTVGNSTLDIWEFLNDRNVKSEHDVAAFIQTVKTAALLPGDYYCSKGRHAATAAITYKLTQELARASLPMTSDIQSGVA